MTVDSSGFLYRRGDLETDQKEFLKSQANAVIQELDADFALVPRESGTRIELLEVCCPADSGLSQAVNVRGGNAARIGLHNFDISTATGAKGARAFAAEMRPRCAWFSTPCGPFSPVQTLFNEKTAEQKAKSLFRKRKSRRIIKTGIKMAEDQIERGDHLVWEWPANNHAWREPEMKKFLQKMARKGILHVATLDGCMMGVKAPDTGEPMRKQWRIVTTSLEMKRRLSIRCDKSHHHVECIGHDRPRQSGFYPARMCKTIAQVVMEMMSLAKMEDQGWALGLQDEPCLSPKLSDGDRKKAEALVHRLHVRAGHPSNRLLANVLRARGAHQEVIKIAMDHRCADCQEMRLGDPAPSVSIQQSLTPWKVIQIDSAEIRVDDMVTQFMVITDEATHGDSPGCYCQTFRETPPRGQERHGRRGHRGDPEDVDPVLWVSGQDSDGSGGMLSVKSLGRLGVGPWNRVGTMPRRGSSPNRSGGGDGQEGQAGCVGAHGRKSHETLSGTPPQRRGPQHRPSSTGICAKSMGFWARLRTRWTFVRKRAGRALTSVRGGEGPRVL